VSVGRQTFPPVPPPFVRLEVHVNRADAAELASLPGIGPELARRIVEDRRRQGPYLTPKDLSRVKGVSTKVLARLNGLVRFD
jgi:competence protein ComEA